MRLFYYHDIHHHVTILHSLSIIRLATAAENPAKTTECMAPILAQAKWKQLIPGSLVNKYKLDLLWYSFPAKHLPFCKPVDAIRYRKYARLLQKGHWAQILWLFYHLFC
jgi:hypothetical protein